jgi:carbon storage regulator
MLVLTRRADEGIVIGDDIMIKVISIDEGRVRLGISAPADIVILRQEVYQAIQQENREAAIGKDISIDELNSVLIEKGPGKKA